MFIWSHFQDWKRFFFPWSTSSISFFKFFFILSCGALSELVLAFFPLLWCSSVAVRHCSRCTPPPPTLGFSAILVHVDVVRDLRLVFLSLYYFWLSTISTDCVRAAQERCRHTSVERNHRNLWSILRITFTGETVHGVVSQKASLVLRETLYPVREASHQQTADVSLKSDP